MDTNDRLDVNDIRQAAIVMATFAYQSAMTDRKLPDQRSRPCPLGPGVVARTRREIAWGGLGRWAAGNVRTCDGCVPWFA